MAQTENQLRASQAVAAWLAERERNNSWLVAATGADPATIGDFLSGSRWPKLGNQGKIEKAIGWDAGTLNAVSRGGPTPDVTLDQYVAAPGELEDESVSNADILKAIREMRADIAELKRGRA